MTGGAAADGSSSSPACASSARRRWAPLRRRPAGTSRGGGGPSWPRSSALASDMPAVRVMALRGDGISRFTVCLGPLVRLGSTGGRRWCQPPDPFALSLGDGHRRHVSPSFGRRRSWRGHHGVRAVDRRQQCPRTLLPPQGPSAPRRSAAVVAAHPRRGYRLARVPLASLAPAPGSTLGRISPPSLLPLTRRRRGSSSSTGTMLRG
jgi:hypothetical protein